MYANYSPETAAQSVSITTYASMSVRIFLVLMTASAF